MSYAEDPRIADAKAMKMRSVVERLGIPAMVDNGEWLSGPCFECGGRDRFNINTRDNGFFCRHDCGVKGGDQIALAQQYLKLSFPDALTELCGDRPVSVDPKLAAQRKEQQERLDREAAQDKNRYREKALRDARAIWNRSEYDPQHPRLLAYFERRGIPSEAVPHLSKSLRFCPNLPYSKTINGQWQTLHEGPAMVAAVLSVDGVGRAVHRTWLDFDQPKGKAVIRHEGDVFDSKMVRGLKKGGAIHLSTPNGADTLVMGEGIETTLTAMVAAPYENAAYWAGVDLGNMAGKMLRGKGLKFAGRPDMTDAEAFVPPIWVKTLVFIQDGDSEPRLTRAKMLSGLRRAQALRPGLRCKIVHAGEGCDLNDVVMGESGK